MKANSSDAYKYLLGTTYQILEKKGALTLQYTLTPSGTHLDLLKLLVCVLGIFFLVTRFFSPVPHTHFHQCWRYAWHSLFLFIVCLHTLCTYKLFVGLVIFKQHTQTEKIALHLSSTNKWQALCYSHWHTLSGLFKVRDNEHHRFAALFSVLSKCTIFECVP